MRISIRELSQNPQFMRLLPLILLFLLTLLLASGLFEPSDKQVRKSRVIGMNVGEFSIPTLDNKGMLTRDSWKGKIVIINIFASWCEPCAVEHPVLMKLAQSGKVEMIGIAWKDKPENTAAFLKKYGVPFHQIGVDTGGDTTFSFGLTGVPETFVIDASGKIAYNHKAPITEELADTVILPLVEYLKNPNAKAALNP